MMDAALNLLEEADEKGHLSMLIPQEREKHLLILVEKRTKAGPSCRLQQSLQVEIGTSLHSLRLRSGTVSKVEPSG
jgi:hypothetical protein